ncbi:hypothetical protein Pla52o_34400 [Novipirellula galeiformis]|uniref:Uncharacterized protein n=1 Tax=Novipirellula galeiformis TaxID=2528004 RepID=A0A5C6CFS6_9BACT|nr:hypothetical protein [Novipirellula galeiformis]TWU22384.1 hypothetical protein Pla52o_34400 [Novipirellula galeiformis]
MTDKKKSREMNWSAISGIAAVVASIVAVVALVLGANHAAEQRDLAVDQMRQQQQQFEAERDLRMQPFVAFDRVTFAFPVEATDVKGRRFDLVRKDGVVIDHTPIPTLTNYGAGPALHVEVSYEGNDKKLFPTSPMHMLPEQQTNFFFIPDALNNSEKPERMIKGTAFIRCRDSRGRQHRVEQKYTCSTDGKTVQFQFGTITTLPIDFTMPEYSMYSSWSALDMKPTYELTP